MIYACTKADIRPAAGEGGMREDRMRHRCVAAAWIAAWCWAALVQAPASASAQAYPDRSVRIVIAFAAGGTIDTLGRIVAQKLSEAWGQSVFVENRPGASGNIGGRRRRSRRLTAIRFTSADRCWRSTSRSRR